ncbi:RkpR, polysaccharide export protein [Rhizobium sp. CG5]|uniref:RkpR, polysaccharide export protein n=1 Tax=Rhizobium sp. CG5 TaxID=2726076 RepID=UPI002034900D|nr:RkpR, polysaccharide export protein [Rhizobium sp. CG5]MCM2477155.1 RkpR, polysaccharide export protein [Rhizobium sp. CG5]
MDNVKDISGKGSARPVRQAAAAVEKRSPERATRQGSHPNVRVLESLLDAPGKQRVASPKQKKTLLARLKLRHMVIAASFLGLVVAPAVVGTSYMLFVAADQYHSSASFSVRSIDSVGAASDILGMFAQSSSTNTASDSYILMDYVMSERMVAELDQHFNLEDLFKRRGADFVYGIGKHLPIEDKLAYWRRMASMNFDMSSGIMQLEIKSFDPAQSQEITNFVLARCEALINDLSMKAREEVLKTARSEILLAEKRLADARIALREFRDVSQEVDPIEGAKLATQLVGGLEQKLASLNADLSTARAQMGEDTPRIRVLKATIGSIEKQIDFERQRLGSGGATGQAANGQPAGQDVAGRLQVYEQLETEREFAERTYTAALASMESARMDANGKQRYLAVFVNPTLSELAQYPARWLNSFLVLLAGLFVWGVLTMSYYNIRDRA